MKMLFIIFSLSLIFAGCISYSQMMINADGQITAVAHMVTDLAE